MTAGKTICINHFLINDSWYLVDLPGYGCVDLLLSESCILSWNRIFLAHQMFGMFPARDRVAYALQVCTTIQGFKA